MPATVAAPAPPAGAPDPGRQPWALRAGLSSMEVLICLMEFLFGLAVLKAVHQGFFTDVLGVDPAQPWAQVAGNVLSLVAIVWWSLFRFGRNLGLTPGELLRRLGLGGLGGSLGVFGVALLAQAAGLVWSFASRPAHRFSLENYCNEGAAAQGMQPVAEVLAGLVEGGNPLLTVLGGACGAAGWNWNRLADIILLAPVREEIVFRGIIFGIFYKRLGSPAPGARLGCIAAGSAVFALVHLLNSFGSRYTRVYIGLQVALGMWISLFYGLRLERSGSLLQPVLLHMLNNFGSGFLPTADFQLSDPGFLGELAVTVAVYTSLIAWDWYCLFRVDPVRPSPLLPTAHLLQSPQPAGADRKSASAGAGAAPAAAAAADTAAKPEPRAGRGGQ